MAKNVIQIVVVAAAGIVLASIANAQLISAAQHRKAPAPFLAAGIPALVALGSAGVFGRIKRRRRDDNDASSGESSESDKP